MKVLVVGSGGREHALVWKLSQDARVLCAPGNAGISQDCETFDVAATDTLGICSLAQIHDADLVVVGPEDPLIGGLADALAEVNVPVFGPSAAGARLEASKAWSKQQMALAGVPTAEAQSFTEPALARDYVRRQFASGRQVAVKASGAAVGKGVIVCDSEDQALEAVDMMLARGELGEAGETVVIEERLLGREFSLLTVVSGTSYRSLPVAQDYKRIGDGDVGPNTGGMGSCSPVDWVAPALIEETEAAIVEPMVRQLSSQGVDYRGILFSGLMVVDGKPLCLEYNVRSGDPETQSVVRRIDNSFAELLLAAAIGSELPEVKVKSSAVVTVVAASQGYPGAYEKGKEIVVGPMPEGVVLFHAGTKLDGGKLVTNGGRVIGVSAESETLERARALAYLGISHVSFEGMCFRSDIAKPLMP